MATSCHRLLCYNSTIEEDDNTLPSSFSFQTQRRQNTQKNNKKNQEKGRSLPSNSRFYPFVSNTFSWHLFLLKQNKRKQNKGKKNHNEKKNCRERRELSFKLLLYPLTFGSCFYPFVSNTFS
jgi:hypothetical protein